MSIRERVFHAILFELLALAMVVPLAMMVSDKGASSLVAVGIGLSVYTVIWNYFYNIWFDHWFDKHFAGGRASRTLFMRFIHTLGFEAGIIFITVPLVAWFLGVTLMTALLLEAAFLIFFFVYAIVFNWCYDTLRRRLFAV